MVPEKVPDVAGRIAMSLCQYRPATFVTEVVDPALYRHLNFAFVLMTQATNLLERQQKRRQRQSTGASSECRFLSPRSDARTLQDGHVTKQKVVVSPL